MSEPHLDSSRPAPYCAGCGHPHVLRALDDALRAIDPPHESITLVTDIGCVGLADSLFPTTHTVHTLHGRSVAVAAGLRMGDPGEMPDRPKPIVLIGDGGVGIGLLHVVHAAQLNVDVTVLVHNNLIYGMTGGQHSVLTPERMKTTTTPGGSWVPPLDLGAVMLGAGAGFFARDVAPGETLIDTIARAIRHPGFSCVEIFELCPTFATAKGGVTGRTIRQLPVERGLAMGILKEDSSRPAFPAPAPRRASSVQEEDWLAGSIVPDAALHHLDRTVRLIAAGRAGEKVQSAALLAAAAAIAAGLSATVRTDNPVTQGSGFSLAEVVVSPGPIHYTGMESPDLVLVTAPEGLNELAARGLLRAEAGVRRCVVDAGLAVPSGVAVQTRDLRRRFGAKNATLAGLAAEVALAGWWERKAWESAAGRQKGPRGEETLALLASAWEA